MPVATVTTSAAGSLALLKDEDLEVRKYALQHLLAIVPQFWAEISEELPYIESLVNPVESETLAVTEPSAALLCSKVFFYLGERDEAVEFALLAGNAFAREPYGEFKETIIAGCIDRAIADTAVGVNVDPRLEEIVDSVIRNGTGEGAKLAIGLALSLRRINLIDLIYDLSRAPGSEEEASASTAVKHDESLLRYILSETIGGAGGSDAWPESFRKELLGKLLVLFQKSTPCDYNAITQIWVQLDNPTACGEGIIELLEKGGEKGRLEALQVAFDVSDMAPQSFVERLRTTLTERGYGVDGQSGSLEDRTALENITNGSRIAEIYINFLKKNNHTDMSILKVTKDSLEDRFSLYHSAITFTNAFAHCGTTSDRFLRENLDWLGRASNWAKFSATAALGLIHRGSYINGVRVVTPYLPGGTAPSKFSEGGALFALGLIYTGRKEGAEQELRKGLSDDNDPIVQHGAALGLGVSALATGDEAIYDALKDILFQDDATSSEAAGYAMGLVMLGQPNDTLLEEMIAYASETRHEKIVRSVVIGAALTMYGKRHGATEVLHRFTSSNNAIIRYGGMFVYALAYVGTGDNKVIKQLLHYAVSDVNDDVRRAAVIALGFVLFRNHVQVPRVVQLLAESYNPHVRHGATLALGISCAGTGLEAAIDLLEPMTKDPVDFVRQGAFIALAMILIQQTEAQAPKVTQIRELFSKVVADKHEDPLARFGASLAQGIIDAGGRNMTISLATRAGTPDMKAIVGMVLFVQFWYWFPLAHFLGLTFTPTTIIAVDSKLRIPKVDFVSWAKPSIFDYPSTVKPVAEEKKVKVKAAVLSTTAKSKARAKSKKVDQSEAIETEEKPETAGQSETKESVAKSETTESAKGNKLAAKERKTTELERKTAEPDRKPSEPSFAIISNMSRITPSQLPFVSGPYDPFSPSSTLTTAPQPRKGRYLPVRAVGDTLAFDHDRRADGKFRVEWSGKVVLVADTALDQDGEYIELDASLWPRPAAEDPQPQVASPPTTAVEPTTIPAAAATAATASSAAAADWDAPMPPAFEYPFEDDTEES